MLVASGVRQYASSYDLFLRDYWQMAAKLYQPCAGSDPSAADTYQHAMARYNKINSYCAGPHMRFECTQWGMGNPDANRNWYAVFSAEANKALSNSGYSADLDGGVTQSVAGNPSGGCKSAYDRQEAEFRPISQQIANTSSAVRASQLTMGMISKRLALLDQLCKGQPQYGEYASMKQAYDSTVRSCRGVASNLGDCVPR